MKTDSRCLNQDFSKLSLEDLEEIVDDNEMKIHAALKR